MLYHEVPCAFQYVYLEAKASQTSPVANFTGFRYERCNILSALFTLCFEFDMEYNRKTLTIRVTIETMPDTEKLTSTTCNEQWPETSDWYINVDNIKHWNAGEREVYAVVNWLYSFGYDFGVDDTQTSKMYTYFPEIRLIL